MLNSNEKDQLIKNTKSIIHKKTELFNDALQQYFTTNKEEIINNIHSNTSTEVQAKVFIRDFSNRLSQTKGQNITSNISFINNEINSVIQSNDDAKLKAAKLVFLSVYKHSHYFWNNH